MAPPPHAAAQDPIPSEWEGAPIDRRDGDDVIYVNSTCGFALDGVGSGYTASRLKANHLGEELKRVSLFAGALQPGGQASYCTAELQGRRFVTVPCSRSAFMLKEAVKACHDKSGLPLAGATNALVVALEGTKLTVSNIGDGQVRAARAAWLLCSCHQRPPVVGRPLLESAHGRTGRCSTG